MIRSLRKKFIFIAMASLLVTMALLCAAIGLGNRALVTRRADSIIDLLHENGGEFPRLAAERADSITDPLHKNGEEFPRQAAEQADSAADPLPGNGEEFSRPNRRPHTGTPDFQITKESPFETRYFAVSLTAGGEVQTVNMDHIAAFDRRSAVERIETILDEQQERGYADYYRYGVFPGDDGGRMVIVLDCFMQLQTAANTLRMVLVIFSICAGVVFILLLFLSGRVVRPFAENLERQRQFITDASHELKTPLAILSADMSLLGDSYGENQWLDSARAQIQRLDKLTKNLVELARTEEAVKEAAMTTFSLSDVAQANIDAFTPLAGSAGKTLEAEVEGGIELCGVQDNLFRLFSILLDNAVKYCDPGGAIRLSVKRQGRGVRIVVSNPCQDLDPAQLPRYFDRFYRADSSRARTTGGYGIGLSTAKAIVLRHKGKIDNRYVNGVISFSITLPCA